MDDTARLRLVARRAGLTLDEPVERLVSYSNDAWRVGGTAVRICWQGDRARLRREALVLQSLPQHIPHAELLDAGLIDDPGMPLSWTLTRWIDARPLTDIWDTMSQQDCDAATDQLADSLRALHDWQPDHETKQALAERPAPSSIEAITGADLNPLPVDRALKLVRAARDLAGVHPADIDLLVKRLRQLQPFDATRDTDGVVVHGDAHLGNVLWSPSERIATLIDLEWVRLGPPDLELQPLLRPEEGRPSQLIPRLARRYPTLLDHPNIVERLWLYDIAFTLRHLLVWPPSGPTESLPPFHPVHRLPQILKSPNYLDRILHSAS